MTTKSKYEPVQDAPTFKPNADEFADPLTYIEKIRPVAEKYGVCKIVPPENWKPTFCIDMDTFKFTPRVQRLNELEAGARIKMNFLDKLTKFWELQGQELRIPVIERKQVDLYKLYTLASNKGDNLTDMKILSEIAKEMNFKETSAKQLKANYLKLIYPYVLVKLGATLSKSATQTSTSSLKRSNSNEESSGEVTTKKKRRTSKKYENINCLICTRGDDDAFILLCDECDDSYHTYCLIPPISEIPAGEWRCPNCIAEICKRPTDSYGFEQSKKKYSLNEFGQMANKFKENYFKKKKENPTHEEIEQEFWRILASPNESVVVEYGADLHTLETGSGFPTYSSKTKLKPNQKEYLNSPWNLNNLPKLDKSILSQINIDISGMKVPWAYVGMLFSCFCWHVEDHWSYSINYLHWGDTKTWYGVSGHDADKFEAIMKKNANELFESSPDLLHHLVTIMDPNTLNKDGVPIYRVNQQQGEFVITFPRAYHAGFNQGFNFAEAVNFCPADWIPIGRAAIENYKLVKRHSVFSHDELVFRTACSKTINDMNIIEAIRSELTYLIRLEQQNQLNLKDVVTNWKQLTFEILTDDERTCDYCNTTCFLSAVKCSCAPTKLACPNHYEHICKKSSNKLSKNSKQKLVHKRSFIYRYSIDEMHKILNELKGYKDDYAAWCAKAETLLGKIESNNNYKVYDFNEEEIIKPNKKPHMDEIVKLIEQARLNNYNKFQLGSSLFSDLKAALKHAHDLIDSCRSIITRYKSLETKLENDTDDEVIFIEEFKNDSARRSVSINDFKHLLRSFASLKCEIEEEDLIKMIYKEINEEELKIEKLIQNEDISSARQIRKYLNYLSDLNIEFDEKKLSKLKLMLKQASWIEQVNEAQENPSELTLRKINNLIDRVLFDDLLKINENKKYSLKIQDTYKQLLELLSLAESWDTKARNLLISNEALSLKLLESTYAEASAIPAKLDYVEQLKEVIKSATDLNVRIKQALEKKKPSLNHLYELLNETKKFSVIFNDLESLKTKVEYTNEWIVKLNNSFMFNKINNLKSFLKQSDTNALMVVLNPRLDIRHLIDTLHQNVNQSNSYNNNSNSNQKSKSKLYYSNDLNESSLIYLYTQTNIFNIKEKIKTCELKEVELIKEMRQKNLDKLKSILDETSSLKKSSLKCCVCYKTVQANSSLNASNFDICKLCYGMCHKNSNCKTSSTDNNVTNSVKVSLCSNCKRSRRPHIDSVYEMILAYEKLEVTCTENKALQMFFNRFTKWQERFDKFFDSESLAQIKLMINKPNELANVKRIYSDMSSTKRVELNELNMECLLLETHNEYTLFLNEFCELIDLSSHCYSVDISSVLDNLSKLNKTKKQEEPPNDDSTNAVKKSKRISKKLNKDSLNEKQKKKKKTKKTRKTETCLIIENKSNNSQEIIDLNEESMDSNKTEYDSDSQLNEDIDENNETSNNNKIDSDAESVSSSSSQSSSNNVFCLCKRGSYGQMICCDNSKCKIEWFHFECVRLKSKPKGKWFCPNCKNNNNMN